MPGLIVFVVGTRDVHVYSSDDWDGLSDSETDVGVDSLGLVVAVSRKSPLWACVLFTGALGWVWAADLVEVT